MNKNLNGLVAGMVLFWGVAHAQAGYTTISPPLHGEAFQATILSHVYGGSFVGIGVDFTNGTVTATRVQDYPLGPGPASQAVLGGTAGAADQIWHDGFVKATAQARFAAYPQTFGYFDGISGGSFTSLFSTIGNGFAVSGSSPLVDLVGHSWRWGRSGTEGPQSSLQSDNAYGADHMVTYKITGLNDLATVWLLFWEDLDRVHGDRDFNDLAVEVRAMKTVPLPSAAMSGMGMLVVFGAVRAIQKMK